jgi:hypothetical protein
MNAFLSPRSTQTPGEWRQYYSGYRRCGHQCSHQGRGTGDRHHPEAQGDIVGYIPQSRDQLALPEQDDIFVEEPAFIRLGFSALDQRGNFRDYAICHRYLPVPIGMAVLFSRKIVLKIKKINI